ncbi:MAG TPA: DUF5677 domain-containing protein [Verrucomicrobiae bacterium]|nr:DUF5677 domain-containing protein [Verrucomicrobiae bacterium]
MKEPNDGKAGDQEVARLRGQLKEASALLSAIAGAAFQPSGEGSKKDAVKAFISRHAWNIHARGEDIITMSGAGRTGALPIINRAALESLFFLAAAAMRPEYVFQKILHEIAEYKTRYAYLEDNSHQLDEAVRRELDEFEQGVRATAQRTVTEAIAPRKCSALDAAQQAGMEELYRMHYWGTSNTVHANIFGLQTEEDREAEDVAQDLVFCVFMQIKTGEILNSAYCGRDDFKKRIAAINGGGFTE